MQKRIFAIALAGAALAACSGCAPRAHQTYRGIALRTGTAEVLSVNPYLRTVKLKVGSHTRTGWWTSNLVFHAYGKSFNTFAGKPGQTIRFHGMFADGEYYLASARVIRGRK